MGTTTHCLNIHGVRKDMREYNVHESKKKVFVYQTAGFRPVITPTLVYQFV
jgi:hypothetical protein